MVVHREFPRTLLPIDRWAQLLGIDPRHFRQVETAKKPNSSCAQVWKQYSWQEADMVGRFDVADAILQAEKTIAQYVGYSLLPKWEVDERQQAPKPGNLELLRRHSHDARGFHLSVNARKGHFVEGGVETKTLIEAAAAIVFTDRDGDGYFETATITVATTVTDDEEIAVFYPDEDGVDRWEIRPLNTVSIAGGVATITCWRHQLVLPELVEALNPTAVDGDSADGFLTTVDVYRRHNNPDGQLTLIWDPNVHFCGSCGSTTTTCCPVCGQTTQDGCLMPQDYRTSRLMYRAATFEDGEFTTAEFTCNRNPDQLLLNYRAGLEDKTLDQPKLRMAPEWERAVAYYALALLDRPVCGCAPLEGLSNHWRRDMAEIGETGRQVNDALLNNPLGTTRAAVKAWNMIKEPDRRVALPARW